MNKINLDVPAGIRFIPDWKEFELPKFPVIINKQITGCGFTEYCIRSNQNTILCSPRKILLENKEGQHEGEVLYVKNDLDNIIDVDKDLNKDDKVTNSRESELSDSDKEKIKEHIDKMKFDVQDYYMKCTFSNCPCKILVTYDSFRYVKDALGNSIINFHVVVDEFQSIFTDSRFKSDTEMEFLNHIRDIQNLCFVSATPMMDEFLDMLPDFRDLPYIEMRWDTLEPLRIIKPELSAKPCKSIIPIATEIIRTYQEGKFQKYTFLDEFGNIQEIESRELVVYVNSVKNICDIIKKCKLRPDNTNVLCSNTSENQRKIRKAFGLGRGQEGGIGEVPKKGGSHKMFTLCTRTVYLGADFYSTCARSLILSDANVDCLAVDITLDLPQILGRQRLLENPWKNRAELYFKSTVKEESLEELVARIKSKKEKTNQLLSIYSKGTATEKHTLAEKYKKSAKSESYRDDYVAVNTHGGKDLFPVFNELVMVSEIRAFQIQQIDYKDRFSVINTIGQGTVSTSTDKVTDFLVQFDSYTQFTDKMKFLCDNVENFTEEEFSSILGSINLIYKNYYITLGRDRIRALQYRKYALDAEYQRQKSNQFNSRNLDDIVYSEFSVGEKYLKSYIKQRLGEIYESLGINLSPKAIDIEKYFEVKLVDVVDEFGKRTKGFKLMSKKN